MTRNTLKGLHYYLVMVYGYISRFIDRCKLMLSRCYLVMLCLGGYAHLPKLNIYIMHERSDTFSDNTKVMVIHLLTFGSRRTEKRSSCKYQIFPLQSLCLIHKEIFLLGTNTGCYLCSLCISEKSYYS